ncbi:MAG: tetratricopeptide repeat protein [Pyrinomonadaceae bacterium]
MDAVISGQAGKALLLNGNSLLSFDMSDPATLVPRQQADVRFLFGEAGDLRILENTTHEAVTRELRRACDCDDALDLTLISFDPELPAEIRREAIEELEALLADGYVGEHLEYILYGRPLPASADLAGALNHCGETNAAKTQAMLRRLTGRQVEVREVSAAWDAIAADMFGGYEERAEFQRVAVREGLFRALVMAREAQATSTFLINAGLNASIIVLKNHRQVLQQWIAPFRQSNELRAIAHETEEPSTAESRTKEQRGRRKRIDRNAVLRKVNTQKALIIETMQRYDLARVGKLVEELVDYQLENGEAIHAAKSLCDLAFEAKTLGLYSLQLELAKRSTDVKPDDAWSWTQYGDAFLKMQRPAEALNAYEQAEAFGAGAVAKNGRAEVLKSLGRLDDALKAYDAIIASYPRDVFAKTGRAEVLKSLGRLGDALKAYDVVIEEYPDNVVAKTGRADVLKSLGRLGDALKAYDAIIEEYPDDVVAKTGRADVLKLLGRLDDSLEAYNDVISNYPQDSIARNARSCVLAALRRYDEALENLPNENPTMLQDWIGYHIRGMILLRTGETDEAVRIFEHGVQNNPFLLNIEYFRTALTIALLRQREFIPASKMLDEVTSPLLQPQANVLRLHAFGALGDIDRAIAAYQSLASSPPLFAGELIEELNRQYISDEAPCRDEEWISNQEIDLLLLTANEQVMISSSFSALGY